MSLIDPNEIPGYSEAVEKEQRLRDIAFLGLPIPLCGIAVKQFTLRHLILLRICDNAFAIGTIPTLEDVKVFLWFVSTGYTIDPEARKAFMASLKVERMAGAMAIAEYLADAFYDAPGNGRGGQIDKLYTSSAATFSDIFATAYGWDDESILEKPIARLFQYLRQMKLRNKPGMMIFNRTEKIISDWKLRGNAAPSVPQS